MLEMFGDELMALSSSSAADSESLGHSVFLLKVNHGEATMQRESEPTLRINAIACFKDSNFLSRLGSRASLGGVWGIRPGVAGGLAGD